LKNKYFTRNNYGKQKKNKHLATSTTFQPQTPSSTIMNINGVPEQTEASMVVMESRMNIALVYPKE